MSRLFIRSYSQNLPYKNEVYFGGGPVPLPPSLDGIKFFAKSQLIIMIIVKLVV